jgi:hypothetical protein
MSDIDTMALADRIENMIAIGICSRDPNDKDNIDCDGIFEYDEKQLIVSALRSNAVSQQPVIAMEELEDLAEWARAVTPMLSLYAQKFERIAEILDDLRSAATKPDPLRGALKDLLSATREFAGDGPIGKAIAAADNALAVPQLPALTELGSSERLGPHDDGARSINSSSTERREPREGVTTGRDRQPTAEECRRPREIADDIKHAHHLGTHKENSPDFDIWPPNDKALIVRALRLAAELQGTTK